MSCDLSNFYEPIRKKNPRFKYICKNYISFLFRSEQFKVDFIKTFHSNGIQIMYLSKLHRKIEHIIKRFFSQKESDDKEFVEKYFQSNK